MIIVIIVIIMITSKMLVTPGWVKEGGKVNSPWSWQLLLSNITPLCLGSMVVVLMIIFMMLISKPFKGGGACYTSAFNVKGRMELLWKFHGNGPISKFPDFMMHFFSSKCKVLVGKKKMQSAGSKTNRTWIKLSSRLISNFQSFNSWKLFKCSRKCHSFLTNNSDVGFKMGDFFYFLHYLLSSLYLTPISLSSSSSSFSSMGKISLLMA